MKIYDRNDIRTSETSTRADGTTAHALPAYTAHDLSKIFLYAAIGGGIGFALRGLLYMAGFKQWMFVHIPSFVSLGNVLKTVDNNWGSFVLMMVAFFGTIWGIFIVIQKFLVSVRRSDNG